MENKNEKVEKMIKAEVERRKELLEKVKEVLADPKLDACFILALENDGTITFTSNLKEEDTLIALSKKVDGKNFIEYIVDVQYKELCEKYPKIVEVIKELEEKNHPNEVM